jgi:hypothetical protein
VNPWRRKRGMTIGILILALSFLLPAFWSTELSGRFEEAQDAGLVARLDTLEMHYWYVVAVVPKIAENLFGELASSLDRSYMLWFNSLADVVVFIVLAKRHLLTVRSDLVYLCMLGAVFMGVSLVIQPRYFYFIYALLCLQAATTGRNSPCVREEAVMAADIS